MKITLSTVARAASGRLPTHPMSANADAIRHRLASLKRLRRNGRFAIAGPIHQRDLP